MVENITKKEFKETLTKYETVFLGITKELVETTSIVEGYKERLYNGTSNIAFRNATYKGEKVTFDDDCVLYVDKHCTCYKEDNMLVLEEKWHDDYDNIDCIKYLYYLVMKKKGV